MHVTRKIQESNRIEQMDEFDFLVPSKKNFQAAGDNTTVSVQLQGDRHAQYQDLR